MSTELAKHLLNRRAEFPRGPVQQYEDSQGLVPSAGTSQACRAVPEPTPGAQEQVRQPWPWRKVLAASLVVKAVCLTLIIGSVWLIPALNQGAYDRCIHWPRDGGPTFATHLATWDAAHYLFLSQSGYQKGSHSCAFYPLWPLLIRVCSYATGHDPFLAGLFLANLLSVAGWMLFHYLVFSSHGLDVANRALVLLLAFPGALFFSFIYTESLFFLLIVLFFLLLFREKFFWAAVVGFFLPLTKAVGVFAVVPLLWYLAAHRKPLMAYLACDGPLLGYLCYFVFMRMATGNAVEGFQAQRFFPNAPSVAHILDPAGFWSALTAPTQLHGMTDSAIDRGLFLLVAASLPFVWRLDKTYFWYALLVGVVPAMASVFLSYTRNMMMCFPLFIVLALAWRGRVTHLLFSCALPLLLLAQAWLLLRHINFEWAG
ncbi:MAG TPA: hypothetical protein VG146_07260 [Verrucomicrobiae bacterium]|nr:hypothetical protein [Verrucomicrobiae bacterium]